MNLWNETIEVLGRHNLTWDDVLYVSGSEHLITKENFEAVAKRTDYDESYGSAAVAWDLMLVGKDWWAVRAEYDGSEWWRVLKQPYVADLPILPVIRLAKKYGGELFELNDPSNDT